MGRQDAPVRAEAIAVAGSSRREAVAEIEHLTVDYPGVRALDDVSLSVRRGDFVGIIGPNGAGKSTLFSCMLGISRGYRGTIRFFGEDVRRSRGYLRRIGYVPQKPSFEENFPATVRDVILMGLPGGGRGRGRGERVEEVLGQLSIRDLAARRIGDLSAGQQQRVFIAKALAGRPDMLILDEPVTGIDAASTEAFYGILREINSAQGITIIWSSHDMDAVGRLASRVACLDRTLFFHGAPGEFFGSEELVQKYSEASMQRHMHEHRG